VKGGKGIKGASREGGVPSPLIGDTEEGGGGCRGRQCSGGKERERTAVNPLKCGPKEEAFHSERGKGAFSR